MRRLLSSIRSTPIVIVAAMFVALAVGFDATSFAAPPPAEPLAVELTAPESCPARPTLLERIRSHTSRVRDARAGETSRVLRVVVTHAGDRFVAELRLVEDSEALERRVPGDTCEEVLAAVALITALTIDPLAGAVPSDAGAPIGEAGPAPATNLPRPPVSEVDAGGPPARPPPPARPHASFGVSLEAYGLGDLVLGSGAWIEGALATRASPALRLRFARTQSFTATHDARPAFFRLTTVALDGCFSAIQWKAERDPFDPAGSTFKLRPCTQIAGGVLDASSSAFGTLHTTPRPWASVGAMLQAQWRLVGPLELEAAAGVALPLVRDEFFFLPHGDVYRAPGAVLLGNVGVGTTFR